MYNTLKRKILPVVYQCITTGRLCEAAEMAKRKVSLMKEIKEEVVQQVKMLMFSITFLLILIVDFFLSNQSYPLYVSILIAADIFL